MSKCSFSVAHLGPQLVYVGGCAYYHMAMFAHIVCAIASAVCLNFPFRPRGLVGFVLILLLPSLRSLPF